jgi:5'-methylthioinosine phosphorylase
MYAIIGGSGLLEPACLLAERSERVSTPYGDPSGPLVFGRIAGRNVVFLARHGAGHTIPPHEINYRANIWALKAQEVTGIVAVATVGGIGAELGPGTLAVPHQILDYTHGRRHTYFDGGDTPVTHIDFTHPYSESLRARILRAVAAAGETARAHGVYAATQGPRLETAAEIDKLNRDGADLVGMTGMPEAALARELGVDYAAIAVVVNFAAGRGASAVAVDLANIGEVMQNAMQRVCVVLERLVQET